MNRKTENLVSVVKGLRNELAELKGVQKMGFDMISLVENSTSASYDFYLDQYEYGAKEVTFTADHQEQPVGRVVAEVWSDSTPSFYLSSIYNNFLSTNGKASFTINYSSSGADRTYYKVWCLMSDSGTVKVESF